MNFLVWFKNAFKISEIFTVEKLAFESAIFYAILLENRLSLLKSTIFSVTPCFFVIKPIGMPINTILKKRKKRWFPFKVIQVCSGAKWQAWKKWSKFSAQWWTITPGPSFLWKRLWWAQLSFVLLLFGTASFCFYFRAMPRGRRSQPRGALVPTPHIDLNTLTVYELRARCHDAGLPETGRKAALVARLSNANQPSTRGTVNQETPPGQHHGAESDPLATDGALERAIERILDRRLQPYGQTQTLNRLWPSSQDPSFQHSAQSETTPPQASTSSGSAPSSFTALPSFPSSGFFPGPVSTCVRNVRTCFRKLSGQRPLPRPKGEPARGARGHAPP